MVDINLKGECNMEKKYELVMENPLDFYHRKLYRVRALKDFADVKKGDLGGFIENENNLSQEENCWVYNNAVVSENARVYNNAKIYDKAEVYGNAKVCDNAEVHDNAEVYGNAKVYNLTIIHDNAKVYDRVEVSGCAEVYQDAVIRDNAEVYNNARVHDMVDVHGDAKICNNAEIKKDSDYLTISPVGSENGIFTAYKCEDGIIKCNRGCFYGTIDEFEAAVLKTHGDSKYAKDYQLMIEYVKSRLCWAED